MNNNNDINNNGGIISEFNYNNINCFIYNKTNLKYLQCSQNISQLIFLNEVDETIMVPQASRDILALTSAITSSSQVLLFS